MRLLVARWLRWLADWLDPPEAVPPLVDPALLAAAKVIVAACEAIPHTSSYKRAQAMKAMIQHHPTIARRDLALAIELAVREVLS
jgi:hypothetical protein